MDPYRIQPVEIQPFNLPNALATHYKLNEMQRSENAQNALADNAPAIFGSDPAAQQAAIKNVAAVDPNSAIQLQRAISQMNDDQLKATQQRLDLGGQIAGSLVSGNIPDNELAAATLKWGIPRAEQLGINVDDIKQAAIAASSTGNAAPLKQLLAQKRDSALTASQQVQAAQSSRDFQYKQGRDVVEDNFKTQQMAETRAQHQFERTKPVALAPGATLVDPRTGQPIYQAAPSASDQRKEQAASEAEANKIKTTLEKADNVISKVNDAISKSQMPRATGVGGALLREIPGTNAFSLDRVVDTIKANVGFDTLQALRDASPTGGALGQVSEMENRLLQSSIASLDTRLPGDQLRQNLDDVLRHYQNIKLLINGQMPPSNQIGQATFGPVNGGKSAEPPQDRPNVIDFNQLPE